MPSSTHFKKCQKLAIFDILKTSKIANFWHFLKCVLLGIFPKHYFLNISIPYWFPFNSWFLFFSQNRFTSDFFIFFNKCKKSWNLTSSLFCITFFQNMPSSPRFGRKKGRFFGGVAKFLPQFLRWQEKKTPEFDLKCLNRKKIVS